MRASWKLANFVEAQRGDAQRTVYVNMDETMISLWQGGRRALVKVEPFADRQLFLDREERGTLAERRQCCSMIAFISDCPKAQELLPVFCCSISTTSRRLRRSRSWMSSPETVT